MFMCQSFPLMNPYHLAQCLEHVLSKLGDLVNKCFNQSINQSFHQVFLKFGVILLFCLHSPPWFIQISAQQTKFYKRTFPEFLPQFLNEYVGTDLHSQMLHSALSEMLPGRVNSLTFSIVLLHLLCSHSLTFLQQSTRVWPSTSALLHSSSSHGHLVLWALTPWFWILNVSSLLLMGFSLRHICTSRISLRLLLLAHCPCLVSLDPEAEKQVLYNCFSTGNSWTLGVKISCSDLKMKSLTLLCPKNMYR